MAPYIGQSFKQLRQVNGRQSLTSPESFKTVPVQSSKDVQVWSKDPSGSGARSDYLWYPLKCPITNIQRLPRLLWFSWPQSLSTGVSEHRSHIITPRARWRVDQGSQVVWQSHCGFHIISSAPKSVHSHRTGYLCWTQDKSGLVRVCYQKTVKSGRDDSEQSGCVNNTCIQSSNSRVTHSSYSRWCGETTREDREQSGWTIAKSWRGERVLWTEKVV